MFEQQERIVTPTLAGCLLMPIEHIGSTSVPGLPAKPIIDMLGVVDSYDAVAAALSGLADVNWLLAPEPGDETARKYSLCYPSIELRSAIHPRDPRRGETVALGRRLPGSAGR
ncbi:GrpB family protein [Microlunatus elymi]|uniref:GrpB family protein n=2 Tax=Microlunatus elymi TaxID=2596828 RepID=A0A516Q569_9ACTN|nr:GrpB family protein [Microlunatus elymi]